MLLKMLLASLLIAFLVGMRCSPFGENLLWFRIAAAAMGGMVFSGSFLYSLAFVLRAAQEMSPEENKGMRNIPS